MELYLKITVVLIVIVDIFHLALLQESTDSPGRTINQSWLRKPAREDVTSGNAAVNETEENDMETDVAALDSSTDYSGGVASGSMAVYNEEENLLNQETGENKAPVVTTVMPPTLTKGKTKHHKKSHTTVSENITTTDLTNSSQVNVTEAEEQSHNATTTPQTSTVPMVSPNSTDFSDSSNRVDLQSTTMAPKSNATQETTTEPVEDLGLTTSTGTTTTTTLTTTPTSATSSTTEVFSSEAPSTSPERANETDKDAASGGGAERGLASDGHNSKRNAAWTAVLGTAVAVACVGLVAYIILKKKHQKGFSHRKLVEEFPTDPVLRLDNSEPLDLNFRGAAYYNPGLQGDNIQMSKFPRHNKI